MPNTPLFQIDQMIMFGDDFGYKIVDVKTVVLEVTVHVYHLDDGSSYTEDELLRVLELDKREKEQFAFRCLGRS